MLDDWLPRPMSSNRAVERKQAAMQDKDGNVRFHSKRMNVLFLS